MANIKSQKKRILITKEENASNNSKRTRVKNAIKKYEAAIVAKDIELATKLLPETVSVLDCAKADGVYHINTVSRKKSALAKMLNSIQAK